MMLCVRQRKALLANENNEDGKFVHYDTLKQWSLVLGSHKRVWNPVLHWSSKTNACTIGFSTEYREQFVLEFFVNLCVDAFRIGFTNFL